jgi:hypothetical protein
VGQAPDAVYHEHPHARAVARRYYGPEAMPQIGVVDPFRSFHLGTKKDRAAQEQNREIGGPQDSFERKRMEREMGVSFVGDDTSGMTAKAKRGISKYQDMHVGRRGET